jgi:hypothetical protein
VGVKLQATSEPGEASRSGRFTPRKETSVRITEGGCLNPRASVEAVAKRNILRPGLEPRFPVNLLNNLVITYTGLPHPRVCDLKVLILF